MPRVGLVEGDFIQPVHCRVPMQYVQRGQSVNHRGWSTCDWWLCRVCEASVTVDLFEAKPKEAT